MYIIRNDGCEFVTHTSSIKLESQYVHFGQLALSC